jgi:Protein of unknown function (DUF1592)/Protein of unknown function (DUF1588)/Protein of unknown function (DUF1587)/Protein of unknown function (DUF1585)/Protein of unknown function (DUF1595)
MQLLGERSGLSLWGMAGAATLIAAAGSCTGVVSNPSNPSNPTGNQSALCQGVNPGPSFIRRVTRLEYNNTVRDLLGDNSGVGNGFPVEERRLGFDNNATALSVSPVLAEQYMLAAETAATNVVNSRLGTIMPCDPATAGIDACGQEFITTFGRKAYRQPLGPDDIAALTAVFNVGKATDFKTGVRLVVETMLQSPRFLYRVEFGAPAQTGQSVVKLDSWEMASRLSYLLWHSMPDDALFAAAEAAALTTPEEIGPQVERMLQDPRAREVVADFHSQWLRVGEFASIEKDAAVYPKLSPTIAGLMQQETAKFLDFVTWDGAGDLNAIFASPFTFVNGPLAAYYGMPGVTGDTFVKTPLDVKQRAGFLTQGGILSLLGKANQTSPVHRGKFVREQLLCTELPPPPADLMIKPPELSTTLTTRERFIQHATDMACTGCHHLMDPIGLGFENFDGAGMFRGTENGVVVDASGSVEDSDVSGPFNGVLELQSKLASSQQVRNCVATKWFRYGYGRGETDQDSCTLSTIKRKFAATGYKTRDLLVALTQSDAFLYRQVMPPAGGGP